MLVELYVSGSYAFNDLGRHLGDLLPFAPAEAVVHEPFADEFLGQLALGFALPVKLYGQAAMMQMVTEKLPDIARAVSEPLSKTEKIILFGEGGATSMARDTAGTMLQTFEAVKEAVGLDIPKAIRDVTTGGLIGKAAQENEKEEKESVKDEPVQAEPEMEETAPELNEVPAEDITEEPEED